MESGSYHPYSVIEEAIVNAVYHRDYQVREPIEIRILPQSVEIINYGGPDRSIRMEDIRSGKIRNRRYRNSRIGDFLKEIELTEGKGTGIPTIKKEMKLNGSPEPTFETDEERSYFIVTLPVHEAFRQDEPINEPINETINETIKAKLILIVNLIHEKEIIRSPEIISKLQVSRAQVHRYLKILKDAGIIDYIGSLKKGGYQLTEKFKSKMDSHHEHRVY